MFEIELAREGCEVVERRLGSSAGIERRRFPSELGADVAYHERMAELVETQWRRRSPCEDRPDRADAELIEAVAGGEAMAAQVYNDWLLDRDDPRGELASLRAQRDVGSNADVDARIAEVEREHGVELFGLLAVLHVRFRAQFELVWRHGWIHGVIARHKWFSDGPGMDGADTREALHHLLHAPMARFVRELDLDTRFADACSSFTSCVHFDRIRRIRLRGVGQTSVLDAFPSLEEVELPVTAASHPRVHTLTIHVEDGRELRLAGAWPALRRLTLVLGERNHDGYPSVRSWLRNHAADASDAIRELVVRSDRRMSPRLVTALAESPLLEQLDVLELDLLPAEKPLRKLEAALQAHQVELRVSPRITEPGSR